MAPTLPPPCPLLSLGLRRRHGAAGPPPRAEGGGQTNTEFAGTQGPYGKPVGGPPSPLMRMVGQRSTNVRMGHHSTHAFLCTL